MLVATFAFARLADTVRDAHGAVAVDLRVSEWFRLHATPGRAAAFEVLTFLGSVGWIASLGVVVAVILGVRRRRLLLLGWIGALIGAGALDGGLKLWFHRPRPQWQHPWVVYPSWNWSFPSGHANGSVVAYGMLAYVLIVAVLRTGAARVTISTAAATLVLTICVSRVALGVHYPTDVSGGLLSGGAWLAVCITTVESARRRPSRSGVSGVSEQPGPESG